jgi:hypothetical protein
MASKKMKSKTSKVLTIDACEYKWTRLDGLRELLEATSGKQINKAVTISVIHADKARNWSFWGGDGYNYLEEAFYFNDGTLIVGVSVTGFVGTFATHHDSKVNYYLLEKE